MINVTSATYFKLEYTNGISTVTIDNKDYTISNGPLYMIIKVNYTV